MEKQTRKAYPRNTTEKAWQLIMPYLSQPSNYGRTRTDSWRDITDAIFYISHNGCTWRALPGDFPHWKTVYHYFRLWRQSGWWEEFNAKLAQQVRQQAGRENSASAASIDSQSVKATETGCYYGYDAGKNKREQTAYFRGYPRAFDSSSGT